MTGGLQSIFGHLLSYGELITGKETGGVIGHHLVELGLGLLVVRYQIVGVILALTVGQQPGDFGSIEAVQDGFGNEGVQRISSSVDPPTTEGQPIRVYRPAFVPPLIAALELA